MLPGTGWCGAGLPPFPTACWWLTHPAAITGVSVAARWDSPGGCGGPSVLLLCDRRVSMMPICFRCAHRPVSYPLGPNGKVFTSKVAGLRSIPNFAVGLFLRVKSYQDMKVGSPLATLPGILR